MYLVNIKTREKGVSVYLAIMIMMILLAISLGISAIIVSQMKMISGMEDSVTALYAADSGVEKVLYEDRLCRQTGCGAAICIVDIDGCHGLVNDSIPPGTAGSINGILLNYQVTFDNGAFHITSIGIYNKTRRAIYVIREE